MEVECEQECNTKCLNSKFHIIGQQQRTSDVHGGPKNGTILCTPYSFNKY